jgi:hypothetical protein
VKQLPLLRKKKILLQVSDKKNKINSILKNFLRRLKDLHKMKRPYKQKIQRWKQRGGP